MTLRTEYQSMLGPTLHSTVTVDAALAELLHSAGHRKDKDIHAVWAACHVLAHLGFVKASGSSIKMKDGTECLHTFFKANKKLHELMIENGQLDKGTTETN